MLIGVKGSLMLNLDILFILIKLKMKEKKMRYIMMSLLLLMVGNCKVNKKENKIEVDRAHRILMVIAPENFRDEELKIPKRIFEKEGFVVDVASREKKKCKGMLGTRIVPDLSIDEVDLGNYSAVVFVGGVGVQTYFSDSLVLNLAREAYDKVKVVGAICLAPVILSRAGLLKGKEATAWRGARSFLEEDGAIFVEGKVVKTGKIVTAPGPEKAKEFALKLLESLKD